VAGYLDSATAEAAVNESTPSLAMVGTDRLGRPFTNAEKAFFSALLREHDFVGASLVGLRFAYKLTHARQASQDLMGRTNLRLVRWGWNPAEVPLARRLCRLVWSEWTHEKAESATARKAEEAFLRELEVTEGVSVPSVEQQASRLEQEREDQARAMARIEELRALCVEAADEVNLFWIEYSLQGTTDLGEMARRSGRDVSAFYAGAKRRKRMVERLIASQAGRKDEVDA
jgi:hypothetical protein